MDDGRTRDYAHLWETMAAQVRPSFTRILSQAQEIRQWLEQTTHLSEREREALLVHLTSLEATADRLVTLTESPTPPADEA